MHETTKEHFEKFKERFLHWCSVLEIGKSWELYFEHDELEDNNACVWTNYSGRCATVKLSTSIFRVPNDEELDRIAKHEALELLMSPLGDSSPFKILRC